MFGDSFQHDTRLLDLLPYRFYLIQAATATSTAAFILQFDAGLIVGATASTCF
jgi:hypothetical protein